MSDALAAPFTLRRADVLRVAGPIIEAGGGWPEVARALNQPVDRVRVMGNKLGIRVTDHRPYPWTPERLRAAATLAAQTSMIDAAAVFGCTSKALENALLRRGISVVRIRAKVRAQVLASYPSAVLPGRADALHGGAAGPAVPASGGSTRVLRGASSTTCAPRPAALRISEAAP